MMGAEDDTVARVPKRSQGSFLRGVIAMRFWHMPKAMRDGASDRTNSRRAWLSGLAVTLTTIVSYFAFWHLSPVVTFVIGCLALVGLVIAGWVLGGRREPIQPSARQPRSRSAREE